MLHSTQPAQGPLGDEISPNSLWVGAWPRRQPTPAQPWEGLERQQTVRPWELGSAFVWVPARETFFALHHSACVPSRSFTWLPTHAFMHSAEQRATITSRWSPLFPLGLRLDLGLSVLFHTTLLCALSLGFCGHIIPATDGARHLSATGFRHGLTIGTVAIPFNLT